MIPHTFHLRLHPHKVDFPNISIWNHPHLFCRRHVFFLGKAPSFQILWIFNTIPVLLTKIFWYWYSPFEPWGHGRAVTCHWSQCIKVRAWDIWDCWVFAGVCDQPWTWNRPRHLQHQNIRLSSNPPTASTFHQMCGSYLLASERVASMEVRCAAAWSTLRLLQIEKLLEWPSWSTSLEKTR